MTDAHVLMLGGTGSGKTCFMLGMYDDLRFGREGFSLSAINPDVDRLFSDLWSALETKRGQSRFPPPSSTLDSYDLAFNYALQRFMTFTWIDYPGGTLYQDSNSGLKTNLQSYLDVATGIFICLPGGQLFDYIEKGRKALPALNIDHVNKMLSATPSLVNAGSKPAITIVITKADEFELRLQRCIQGGAFSEIAKRLNQIARKLKLPPLPNTVDDSHKLAFAIELSVVDAFNAVFAKGGRWNIMICPVTLGALMAEEAEEEAREGKLVSVDAEVDVVNMHLPLLFTFEEYQKRLEFEWDQVRTARSDRVNELESKFFRWFMKDERREARDDLNQVEERLSLISERAEIVRESMPEDAIVYRNGVRVSGPSFS